MMGDGDNDGEVSVFPMLSNNPRKHTGCKRRHPQRFLKYDCNDTILLFLIYVIGNIVNVISVFDVN